MQRCTQTKLISLKFLFDGQLFNGNIAVRLTFTKMGSQLKCNSSRKMRKTKYLLDYINNDRENDR